MTTISPAAPAQADPAASQSNAAPKSAGQPFSAFLKSAAQENTDEAATEPHPLPLVKPSIKKDEKDKAPAGKDKDQALNAIASIPEPQVQDPRTLLLSWRRQQDEGQSGNSGTAQGATTAVLPVEAEATGKPLTSGVPSSQNMQNGQLAFTVSLSKTAETAQRSSTPHDAKGAAAPVEKNTTAIEKPASTHRNSSEKQQQQDDDSKEPAHAGVPDRSAASNAVHATQAPSAPVVNAANTSAIAPSVPQAYTASPTNNVKPAEAQPVSQAAAVTEPAPAPAVRMQNIDLKVANQDNTQVDVRVSQRAGDVQVTVRTPDGELAQSLRQHLPELSDRLAQTGVHGDIWHPTAAQTSTNTSSDNSESWNRDGGQYQQQGGSNNRSNHGQEQANEQSAWADELSRAESEPTEQPISA